MVKNAAFDRCADFLARMIIKYGNVVDLPKTADGQNARKQEKDGTGSEQHSSEPDQVNQCA